MPFGKRLEHTEKMQNANYEKKPPKGKAPAEIHAKISVLKIAPAPIDEVILLNHHENTVEMTNCTVISGKNSIRKPTSEGNSFKSRRNIGRY